MCVNISASSVRPTMVAGKKQDWGNPPAPTDRRAKRDELDSGGPHRLKCLL